jgi:cyclopropane-fatty-acyl-phospholipid synthase
MLLSGILKRIVSTGHLDLIDSKGRRHAFGDANAPADRRVTMRLTNSRVERQLLLNPILALGEGYMDGTILLEGGDIHDLLLFFTKNMGREHTFSFFRNLAAFRKVLSRVQQFNPVGRAKDNVAHHYDLSGELYDLFLDADRQYSCAYFEHEGMSLEEAQLSKKRHLASKLALQPAMRVLDIGSGWGGLGLYLARVAGADVTGVTLSEEQFAVSSKRAATEGMADSVTFRLQDYREVTGRFDRIISVGMLEHVGVDHYREFFHKVRSLLTDDGVAVIHAIGRSNPPTLSNAWTRKYIFPGGYIPSMSEVLQAIEKSGLWSTDIEILRLHYARTLSAWRARFLANRGRIAALYDERFCRMWDFYLASAELTFRYGDLMIFQIQLTRKVDTLPITRDYMVDWERERRQHDESSLTAAPA